MSEEGNRQLDLGNLTLFDGNPVTDDPDDPDNLNTAILNRAASNIYYIFDQLLGRLKASREEQERLPEELQLHDFNKSAYSLKLPPGEAIFPRSRRIPKKREPTKWEKFAKEKGIQKKKRSGKVFDEQTQQYLPRWGSKSKANMEPPIMEEKQPGVNPFKERQLQKKLRISKQQLRE